MDKFSGRQNVDIVFLVFSRKQGLTFISPLETICMKRQGLFSGKNIFKMFAKNFTQNAKRLRLIVSFYLV